MGDMHRVLQLHSTDQPEVHEIAADMRASQSLRRQWSGERVLIGEIYLPVDRLVRYYGGRARGRTSALQLPARRCAVGSARARHADRGLRGRAAPGLLAELGARQP